MSVDFRGRWAYSPVFAIAVAGVLLKFYHWYIARPLWLDEQMIFLNIRDRGFTALTGPLWMDQTAPFGWLALQRCLLQVFGTDDRVVRALSVFYGMGTLACAVWVGLRWMKPAGAAVFVLLCGFAQWTMFYALEAKPYSADAFWALLLPSLAVWAVETRRSLVWWTIATLGQWMSYGAAFVTPGSALLLCGFIWKRHGSDAALRTLLQGVIWLANFALHYFLVMRHARASDFLADFWSAGLMPANASIGGALTWLADRAAPLATHPGGTMRWSIFWLVVAYGLVVSLRDKPALALSWTIVPISAALLAVFRLVPLTDRLAFWIVPALYAAVAAAAADSLGRGREWFSRNNLRTLVVACLSILLVWPLCFDIISQGDTTLNMLKSPYNHDVDDRAAVRFVMSRHQPGDAIVATHYALPALWWYGGMNITPPNDGRRYPVDGAPIIEAAHQWPDARICRIQEQQTHLQRALTGSRRVVVFLGFDSQIPLGLQELMLDEVSGFAELVEYQEFGGLGAAAIFDLQKSPTPTTTQAARERWRVTRRLGTLLEGCITVRPAHRW